MKGICVALTVRLALSFPYAQFAVVVGTDGADTKRRTEATVRLAQLYLPICKHMAQKCQSGLLMDILHIASCNMKQPNRCY
eukprot:IDg4024t1